MRSSSGGEPESTRSQKTSTSRRHVQAAHIARQAGAPGRVGSVHSSMINISIKNTVTSSSKVAQPAYSTLQAPPKPERTYRSSLSRSKSFNVEADRNGVDPPAPTRTPYTSSLHLNRLNETPPPLKSPGILASISRSNRDLLRDGKY